MSTEDNKENVPPAQCDNVERGESPFRTSYKEAYPIVLCKANRIWCQCNNCELEKKLYEMRHNVDCPKNCLGCKHIKESLADRIEPTPKAYMTLRPEHGVWPVEMQHDDWERSYAAFGEFILDSWPLRNIRYEQALLFVELFKDDPDGQSLFICFCDKPIALTLQYTHGLTLPMAKNGGNYTATTFQLVEEDNEHSDFSDSSDATDEDDADYDESDGDKNEEEKSDTSEDMSWGSDEISVGGENSHHGSSHGSDVNGANEVQQEQNDLPISEDGSHHANVNGANEVQQEQNDLPMSEDGSHHALNSDEEQIYWDNEDDMAEERGSESTATTPSRFSTPASEMEFEVRESDEDGNNDAQDYYIGNHALIDENNNLVILSDSDEEQVENQN